MRLDIHIQREIVRLYCHDKRQSYRAIASKTYVHHTTVADLLNRFRASGLEWLNVKDLDDAAWCQTLGTQDRSIAVRKPRPDWSIIQAQMLRPDATLEQLWLQWRETCPTGVAYTQFATSYSKWVRGQHIVMRQIHLPGDKLFVDFAGRTVEIRDPNGGPSFNAQVFVAVLGYSNFTYVEAVADQTTGNWVQCHVNCFEALGGVPAWVVSDNLKAAVVRRERGRVVINPSYREVLQHYDSAPMPARPRKPKDKAIAEVGVQIVQRWILFPLRDRVYFSLHELNLELRKQTEVLNRHALKRLGTSRQERFETTEKAHLKALPVARFELCDWRYRVKVNADYHVELERCFYSVPCQLVTQRVDIRHNATVVEIFSGGRRVALHQRLFKPGEASTQFEHRPIAHQRILEGEPKALLRWAQSAGPHSERMIHHHLQDRTDLANGLRAANRMRELARLYGDDRFEAVCRYALGRLCCTNLILDGLPLTPDVATP